MIHYNIDVMLQTTGMMFNPVIIARFASRYYCTTECLFLYQRLFDNTAAVVSAVWRR